MDGGRLKEGFGVNGMEKAEVLMWGCKGEGMDEVVEVLGRKEIKGPF